MKLIVVVAALALFAGVFCAEECDDNCVSCSDWLSIGVNCFECASGKWMYWNDFSREDIQYYAGTSNYGYCYDDETDCDMSQHRRTTTLSYCYGKLKCITFVNIYRNIYLSGWYVCRGRLFRVFGMRPNLRNLQRTFSNRLHGLPKKIHLSVLNKGSRRNDKRKLHS
jgi:hypothetical protein